MRGHAASLSCGVVLGMLLFACGGCYEEQPPPPAKAASNPAPAPGKGPAGGGQAGGGNAYGGAKRAAQNTADKIQQRQEEVEKAANEPE
jgi:hypothetical protein